MNNPNTIQSLATAILGLGEQDRMDLVRVLAEKSNTPIVTAEQEVSTPQQTRLPIPGHKPTEYQLGNLLIEMGAPTANKGFKYLLTGILMVVDDNGICDNITKTLYPSIAKAHDTTSSRVERAIRHEVECIYDTPGIDDILKDLGVTLCTRASKGKPTNGEFLSGMARMFVTR